ncbi:MAG: hypothetical protein ACRDUA_20255 [Micromonosporaceae bacterium]
MAVHQVVTATAGFEYRAECSCGWASEWCGDDVAAVMAGVEHPELVEPASGFDGFMGELLDVQDDLCRVVEWLAENWSADLPVPDLRGSYRADRTVDVNVQCPRDGDLSRVAELLGAEVAHDPVCDTDDATYLCARRRFGGVVLEAWRYDR